MQVASTRKEAPKESQDWDARAAQEVAAALARGANVGALVDKKQQRADFLRSKAERKQAEASSKPNDQGLAEAVKAARAEVPSQHLCAISGMAPVLSRGLYFGRERMSNAVLLGREDTPDACGSRLAVAAGVDDLGKLSITAAFLSHSPSAAARLWQQVPSGNIIRHIDVETSGPFECVVTIVVVGVLCLFLAMMARTPGAIQHQSFVLHGRCVMFYSDILIYQMRA